jgi:hypothetical protein
MVLAGVEGGEVVAAAMKALALRVSTPSGEGPLLHIVALLGLPFLVQSIVA